MLHKQTNKIQKKTCRKISDSFCQQYLGFYCFFWSRLIFLCFVYRLRKKNSWNCNFDQTSKTVKNTPRILKCINKYIYLIKCVFFKVHILNKHKQCYYAVKEFIIKILLHNRFNCWPRKNMEKKFVLNFLLNLHLKIISSLVWITGLLHYLPLPVSGATSGPFLQQVFLIGLRSGSRAAASVKCLNGVLLIMVLLLLLLLCARQTVQSPNRTALLQHTYLSLPMYLDWALPLIQKDFFSPARGSGQGGLPRPVRELLLPVWPRAGGPPSVSGAAVRTSCERNRMQLQVERSVLGSGEPGSHLKLGTCGVSRSTEDHLYFEYDLRMCGTKRTVSLKRNRDALKTNQGEI